MAAARALLACLAVVAASGQLCERNSQCEMAGGEWCGSHESCGDEDCCISSVPCDVTTSSAHSCLTCSLEFDVTFVITEDCVCLNAELSVAECSDAFARGTPREVADDDDDDDDDDDEEDVDDDSDAGGDTQRENSFDVAEAMAAAPSVAPPPPAREPWLQKQRKTKQPALPSSFRRPRPT